MLNEPSVELLALPMLLTVIVSPTLAPIWNAALLKLPSSSLTPLNEVVDEMRSISAFSACASVLSAARSVPELVALRDCTARSRMRCNDSDTELSAPSEVCRSDTRRVGHAGVSPCGSRWWPYH